MKALEGLPVLVVVRLCTNDSSIVDYWNNIDADLELDLDVLDDLNSEAQEVAKVNDWLNYSQAMHRFREFGVKMKEMDVLDERKLTSDEMRAYLSMM
jgi:hypothetical protein